MTVREFKDRLTEELRTKYKKDSRPTPILDRLDLHLKDFEGYDSASIMNEKNIQSDVYLSMLLQICYPSRIKMDIDENYQPITKKRIAIVNCKSKKQDYACSADEMYSPSSVYRIQREFFLKGYDDWYIISSEYGIIHPNQIIEPYNRTLGLSSVNMDKNNQIQGWEESTLKQVDNQLTYMVNKGWVVDFHVSKKYFDPLSKNIKKQVNLIKQPPGINRIEPVYNEGVKKLDTESLEDVLEFLSKKQPPKFVETPKRFYHPVHGEYYGTSAKMRLKYSKFNLNNGTLWLLSTSQVIQHKGWVIDESLLPNLYQTDSGQWRIKKQK